MVAATMVYARDKGPQQRMGRKSPFSPFISPSAFSTILPIYVSGDILSYPASIYHALPLSPYAAAGRGNQRMSERDTTLHTTAWHGMARRVAWVVGCGYGTAVVQKLEYWPVP